ncbi:hypothetical protein CONLIGDRAFT_162875 [Coniochaeta ligniaria NRRL 30616]|uniref:Uncharacterized protein n=1 Tax=Coniochaeta ligniaria NRRL 30616 TaxID=1408157 RepID=A0A1J7JSY8_9PEZI|nr:hypothetical protein CONLIGDRAFT_162875 [Coniochaeta ligniaria NRRL 30616]
MSSTPDTAPLPSDVEGLQDLISQLNDALVVQRAIHASLEELPKDPDVVSQLDDSKAEFRKIQQRLSEARRAHYQAQKTAKPKLATQTMQQVPNGVNGRDFSGGSRSTSSSSISSEMFDRRATGTMGAGASRPATPSRKRTYSHANVTPAKPGQTKSRRGNPGQPSAFESSPSTVLSSDRDDVSVIDLTGDDEELYKRLEETEQHYQRNKQVADKDAAIARQLHDQGFSVVPSSSSHAPPSSQNGQSTPNYFDRMLPHRSSQTPAPQSAQTARGPQGGQRGGNVRVIPERPSPRTAYLNRQFGPPTVPDPRHDMPRMPGAFFDSDEDNESDPFNGAMTSSGVPPSSRASKLTTTAASLGTALLEAEELRRAAIYGGAHGAAAVEARRAALEREGRAEAARKGVRPSQPPLPGFGPSLPAGQVPAWQAQLEADGFASYFPTPNPFQRPGYVNGGFGNPLLLHGNPLTSGTGVYKSENPDPRDELGKIINRTNGYDYDNMTDATGRPLDSRLRSYINDVMDDPRKTSEELQNLLSNIRPDMEIPEEERGETPEALKYPLYTHQQLALKWMSDMEQGTNKGGILADDMGLGKTISTLSLMVTRKSTTSVKTNLIVGPVALIKQWEAEIRKKLKPEHRLSVILFHQKKIQYSDMKTYDVVLTTYGKLASEYKKYLKHLEARRDSARYDAHEDLELQRQCPLIHPRSKFYRVILDEAQCIKNRLGQASLGCNQLSAEYRWCLTGTPMMNGVTELYPLIRFLKIRPYNELSKFTQHFGGLTAKKYTSEKAKERSMQQLRIVLKAIMLRRMKNSTIDGKPILTLPPKTELIQNCVFSEDEQNFYQQLETKSQVIFNKYLRAGTVGKNYSHVLVLLLRLRQACCHPHLNMDIEYASVNNEVSPETMEGFAKQLDDAVVARLKAAEGFDCPICFDAVADPTIFVPCGHDTCAECFTSLTENSIQANIRSGQEGEDAAAKCPECRAPVQPKKVITYTVFKKVHMPETITDTPDEDKAGVEDDDDATESDSDDETASEANDDDADQNGDLRDFIVADDEDTEYEEEPSAAEDDDEFPEILGGGAEKASRPSSKTKKAGKAKKSKRSKKDKKGKAKADDVKPHMLKTLRLEASKNQEARRKYMRYLKKNWQPSAKTTKVCEILKEIEPSGEKTIIFSQWTALLDLLEIPMKYELGIKYCRYDGGMSRPQRDEAIRQFVENPRVKVLLVSLRAGNAGLNLTVASHVIICDPFWNPFIEMQAVDRAHRIGQQLPVQVHRVLVKGSSAEGGEGGEGGAANALAETVEDRIVTLQDQKRSLINAALDEGESRSLGRLSEQELRYLFGVSSRPAR